MLPQSWPKQSMTNSAWLEFFQLLSRMLDFAAGLSENREGINKTWGRWSHIVEVRLPDTALYIFSIMVGEWPVTLAGCKIYGKYI